MAAVFNKPFLAINHLEGHVLTARLTNNVNYPTLLLPFLVGIAKSSMLKILAITKNWQETIDDALGEAFDKVAQMLGLSYQDGPALEELAKKR